MSKTSLEFSQKELMHLFLSVYTIQNENEEDVSEFQTKFEAVYEKYASLYEVTAFDKEVEKKDVKGLLAKLASSIDLE